MTYARASTKWLAGGTMPRFLTIQGTQSITNILPPSWTQPNLALPIMGGLTHHTHATPKIRVYQNWIALNRGTLKIEIFVTRP
jgi:hypothetical protein